MHATHLLARALSAVLATASAAVADDALFTTRVWPLLERSCIKCHGPEKQKGELRLDSRGAALKGGETGPALVPGKPGESLMFRLVRHPDPDRDRMPPKEKLHDAEIADLEKWIATGAPWPAAAKTPVAAASSAEKVGDAWSDPRNPIVRIFGGRRLDLWSLKPIGSPEPPSVKETDWPITDIDRFVLAKLESANVHPASEADRRTLGRRLYFDLTGLPPSPERLERFINDTRRDAYQRLVDELLASPRYGEHWARMWLDVVRYSDSNGFDWDEFRPTAWRFRDYVIRSLNADKPFDRFIREQLAGDEMFDGPPRTQEQQDCLIATGYLRVGPHDNSAAQFGEAPKVRQQLMADLVETTGAAFLGLTMSCCRCHDHKYDPLSQADHYRLRAFFEPVKFRDDLPLDLADEQEAIRKSNEALEAEAAGYKKERDAIFTPHKERLRGDKLAKLTADEQALLKTPEEKRDDVLKAKIKPLEKRVAVKDEDVKAALKPHEKKRLEELDAILREMKKKEREFTTGLLMADDEAAAPETRVLYQGQLEDPREPVSPGFISALDPNPATIRPPQRKKSTGRRSALADWIVSEGNPLTARVLVNRVWQAHFGEGIVATPNDFGLAGASPTHPELLDWLAREFMRDGWSLKKLHRLIVTSATYRQSSLNPSSTPTDNTFLARQNPRRLTGEALRDSMLAVAGRLIERGGGPPIWPDLPEEVLKANPAFLDDNKEKTKGWYPSPKEKTFVRSIFLVQKRTVRVPMLETFDQPENAVSCARRNVSTVAPQALTLLNSPFATEMAQSFAERVQREAASDPNRQVERAFTLALQRPPSERERAACQHLCEQRSLPELCRALLNLNEFIYID